MIESPIRFCTDNAIKQLIDKYCLKNNTTILDVGCGKGHYYQYFTSHAKKGSYLGIDINEHESWQTKEENGISFLVHDAEKLQNLNQKFDFIAAIQSFEHIKNDVEAIKLGGLTCFLLHFILWTIPAILLKIPIWKFYKKSRFLINSIAKLERLSLSIDKVFCLLEGGYAIVLKKGEELI